MKVKLYSALVIYWASVGPSEVTMFSTMFSPCVPQKKIEIKLLVSNRLVRGQGLYLSLALNGVPYLRRTLPQTLPELLPGLQRIGSLAGILAVHLQFLALCGYTFKGTLDVSGLSGLG